LARPFFWASAGKYPCSCHRLMPTRKACAPEYRPGNSSPLLWGASLD
jgi:hypothetical protein